jgi:hypothetical protein
MNVNNQSVTGALTWNANVTLQTLAITDPFNSGNNQTCSYGRVGHISVESITRFVFER